MLNTSGDRGLDRAFYTGVEVLLVGPAPPPLASLAPSLLCLGLASLRLHICPRLCLCLCAASPPPLSAFFSSPPLASSLYSFLHSALTSIPSVAIFFSDPSALDCNPLSFSLSPYSAIGFLSIALFSSPFPASPLFNSSSLFWFAGLCISPSD